MRHHVIPILVAVLTAASCTTPRDDGTGDVGATTLAVANGTPATKAARPYAAFLEIAMQNGATASCTGTLIAPDTVLTAAHCTVCASSVTVRFLGDAPDGSPDGSPPASGTVVGQSGIFTSAAAYPNPVNCSASPELLKLQLDLNTHFDKDVAIIKLPAPATVAYLSPLLEPPHGFSPVKELFGQDVTVVGRGYPAVDTIDTSTMREGQGSLDRWMYLTPMGESCEPSSRGFSLWMENAAYGTPPGPAEAATLPGDSGGPMIATINGVDRLIGVTSAGNDDVFSVHVPIFLEPNSHFIRSHLGPTVYPLDSDGDGVRDSYDNCPADANTDQMDRDEDGVGDVCDTCMPLDANSVGPLLTRFDGTPASAYAQYYDPDQRNGNQEAENEQFFQNHPSYMTGGTVAPITYAEYTQALATILGAPCNAHLSQVIRMKRYRRGDVCDPIPHATTNVVYEAAEPPDFQATPALPCAGPLLTTCSYEVPTGIEVTPTVDAASAVAPGEVGFRFCECSQVADDEGARRLGCGAGTAADCAIDGERYSPGDASWKLLHVNGGTDTTDAPSAESFAPLGWLPQDPPLSWNVPLDMAALSGVPLPPGPWLPDGGSGISGGPPAVRGILWSHVPEFDNTAIGSIPPDGVRAFATIASYYQPLTAGLRKIMHFRKIPQYKPAFPWEYCPVCGVDFSWLEVSNPADPYALAVGSRGALDVLEMLDQTAKDLFLSDQRRVSASETPAMLAGRGITAREVIVDEATQVVGTIGVSAGKVFGKSIEVAGASRSGLKATSGELRITGESSGPAQALAYSATRNMLFDLVLNQGEESAELRVWSGEDNSTTGFPLTGPAIGTPLAAIYRAVDDALYAVDQPVGGGYLRLLRIDLVPGLTAGLAEARVTILASRFMSAEYSDVALANDNDGGLLVAANLEDRPRLARLVNADDTWLNRFRLDPDEPVYGEVRVTGAQVLYLTPDRAEFEPVELDLETFEPAGSASIDPVF